MFLGMKMTPAAAQALKVNEFPQAYSVCVPLDVWDGYVLGEMPVERSIFAMQLLADLRDYATDGTGAWAFPEVGGMSMKYGLVEHLLDMNGRKIAEGGAFVSWINSEFIRQKPPIIAIAADGLLIRILLGDRLDTRVPGIRTARPSVKLMCLGEADAAAKKARGWKEPPPVWRQ